MTRLASDCFALNITLQFGPTQNRSCGFECTKLWKAKFWYCIWNKLERGNLNTKSSCTSRLQFWAMHVISVLRPSEIFTCMYMVQHSWQKTWWHCSPSPSCLGVEQMHTEHANKGSSFAVWLFCGLSLDCLMDGTTLQVWRKDVTSSLYLAITVSTSQLLASKNNLAKDAVVFRLWHTELTASFRKVFASSVLRHSVGKISGSSVSAVLWLSSESAYSGP